MVASGTFGYGPEYEGLVDMTRLGAVVVKGISPWPHSGNLTPRTVEVTSGLINAIGLQNPGFEGFCEKYLPFWEGIDVPLIVNIWGRTLQDYGEVAGLFDGVERVDGLELNISCPNIKEGGIAFGTKLEMAREVVELVRSKTSKTLITKLSPNVSDIRGFARAVEEAGSDAISLINSMPAMKIDIRRRRPVLANMTGGLTGPCIRPIAVKLVWEAAQAVSIPIIGMGGIEKLEDALEFFMAGARAVAVGTANFYDPSFAPGLADGIADFLRREKMGSMEALVGAALPGRGE
jgi:dihydroorotate dehydrogenase (NAD+) catalytic subunit